MPSGGVASVTVSYRDESGARRVDEVLERLKSIDGVVSLHQVLGEI